MTAETASRIDALLPQTQCTRCGFPACRPYAEAIASGAADINQCPPGGQAGVDALATLLGKSSKPLSPAFGHELPPAVALIDEDVCIGCTKCIQACPVDAIVGAAKLMHTVITAECTGCELCLPPCPVDCISMPQTGPVTLTRTVILERATVARRRFEDRQRRLAPGNGERVPKPANAAGGRSAQSSPIGRKAVLDAIARGKAKRIEKNLPVKRSDPT